MSIEQASIYIGLKQLREQLFFIQALMSKKDQIRFGTPIIGRLNPAWFNYIEFDTHRCCLVAKPEYSYRNRIIKKYNLYDPKRKRRAAPSSK